MWRIRCKMWIGKSEVEVWDIKCRGIKWCNIDKIDVDKFGLYCYPLLIIKNIMNPSDNYYYI